MGCAWGGRFVGSLTIWFSLTSLAVTKKQRKIVASVVVFWQFCGAVCHWRIGFADCILSPHEIDASLLGAVRRVGREADIQVAARSPELVDIVVMMSQNFPLGC